MTLKGKTKIHEDVTILEGCRITDSEISKGSVIGPYVVLDNCNIGEDNTIGPFTYCRPGTQTNSKVKIGGFVETKKTVIGNGSKVPHLSYVGDATIGEDVNIGAGVITCNYDGVNKHKTIIGNNVFVGTDCQLIAPLNIEEGAYVAAGTTVTSNVGKDGLAISRVKQVNKDGYASKIRKKLGKK